MRRACTQLAKKEAKAAHGKADAHQTQTSANPGEKSSLGREIHPRILLRRLLHSGIVCSRAELWLVASSVLTRRSVTACLVALLSAGADLFIGPGQLIELEIGQIFYIDHFVFCFVDGVDELVQFQVNGPGIAILCVLDEKHHEKCHNRSASINDQLPGVGKVEDWAGNGPDQDDTDRRDKRPAGAEIMRAAGGKAAEPVGMSQTRRRDGGSALNRFLGDLHGYLGSFQDRLLAVAYSAATLRSCTRFATSASFAAGSGMRRTAEGCMVAVTGP
jgi:hypothetical protein